MKRNLKRLLVCILIVFVLNNFLIGSFSNPIYASTGSSVENAINKLFSTVVGLLTWPIRLVALAIGLAVDKLMAGVAYIENDSGGVLDDAVFSATLTPFDILSGKIKLLDINFFEIGSNNDSILYKFRTAIAIWYYAMRNIASAILLVVLIYVGIRMALSTVSAEQKATYKKMIVDWVMSIAIIFILHYIILFTIYVNQALVDAIFGMDQTDISSSIDALAKTGATSMSIEAIAATIIYCMLIFQTFGLFISYFNRMLKLAFLIIISPLITLTYSIDKMGDGKAQALNTWLKEFVFTVLIQPFHAILYMTFISVAFELLANQASGSMKSMAVSIIALLCVNFIKEGEKIVRKIFAFADDNQQTSLAAGMAVASIAASKAKNVGKTTRKAVNSAKNIKTGASNMLRSAKVEAIAMGRILTGNNKTSSGEVQTVEELKSDIRTDIDNKKAEKEENKRYGVSQAKNQAAINARANEIMKAGGALTKSEATAKARLAIAKESRKSRKSDEFYKKHPVIKGARGKIKGVQSVLKQSETLRELGKLTNSTIAAGAGLALGSGVYGVTGSMSQGLLSGVAMYRGTGEFLKSSSSTLKRDVDGRLQSLGADGKIAASAKINNIIANADKYEGKDELDKIMKELEKALEKAGVDGKVRTSIRNTIEKGSISNPSASISSLVNNALASNGVTGAHLTSDVMSSTTKLAEFTQEKGIYNTIKQAGDVGMGPDAFVASVIKDYAGVSGASDSSMQTDKEFLDESVKITEGKEEREEIFEAPDDEKAKEFVDNRNERDLQEFYKTCDKEINKAKNDIDKSLDEEMTKDLIARLNQLQAAKAKVQDVELDREIERIRKEYQKVLDKASSATEKEAKQAVNRELSRLQGEYDKYIEQANAHLSRAEIEGTKSEAQITAQKIALQSEQTNIANLRRNLNSGNSTANNTNNRSQQ